MVRESNKRVLTGFMSRAVGGLDGLKHFRLIIAGDSHHYAHYSSVDPMPTAATSDVTGSRSPELVTCGGGGAFLSSTHHLPTKLDLTWDSTQYATSPTSHYTRKQVFPTPEDSKSVFRRNAWLIPFRNGAWLYLLIAAVQIFVIWAAGVALLRQPSGGVLEGGISGLGGSNDWRWPTQNEWMWAIPFVVAYAAFSGLLYFYARYGVGSHGGRPLALLFALAHLVLQSTAMVLLLRLVGFADQIAQDQGFLPQWALILMALPITAFAGMVALTLYLAMADGVGVHRTDAFSALRSEAYKSSLRIRVSDDGLDVYVLGIPKVPAATRWFRTGRPRLPLPQIDVRHVDHFKVTPINAP